MSVSNRRRAVAAVIAMFSCYFAGLALIVTGAVLQGRVGRAFVLGGFVVLAIGATISFLAKVALVVGVHESRRVWWDASKPIRVFRIGSLALWSLPAIAFWVVTAGQLAR